MVTSIIYHCVLSVIPFPTYSSHYHDPPEDSLNISEYFNLTDLNTTSSLEEEEELPRMTNVGLAVALYLACLATVFGNSLVVIAVVKVKSKISSRKSDKAYNEMTCLLLVFKEIVFLKKLSFISYSVKLTKFTVSLLEMSGLLL